MSVAVVPLPRVNPPVGDCTCDPGKPVVYLASRVGDCMKHMSLSLLNQELTCRRFVKNRLRLSVEAEFADRPTGRSSHQPGLAKLLAHVVLCRNRHVIVARLDRLPSFGVMQLRSLGARVLSATEPNSRTSVSQAEMTNHIYEDIETLFPESTRKRKESK